MKSILVVVIVMSSIASAEEMPPLEAYGSLPTVSQMAISPSGSRVASRNTSSEMDALIVQDFLQGKFAGGTDVSQVKPRSIYFLDEDRIILVVSEARRTSFARRVIAYSAAFLFDLNTGESRQLLRRVLFEEEVSRPEIELIGLTPARDAVLINSCSRNSEFTAIYRMQLDDGFLPSYRFFDEELDDLLFRISGGWNSGACVILQKGSASMRRVATQRPASTIGGDRQVSPGQSVSRATGPHFTTHTGDSCIRYP